MSEVKKCQYCGGTGEVYSLEHIAGQPCSYCLGTGEEEYVPPEPSRAPGPLRPRRAALSQPVPEATGAEEIEAIRRWHENPEPFRYGYTEEGHAHVGTLLSVLDAMAEALTPFAAFTLPRDNPQTDDRPVYGFDHTMLTLGDFRRARAALKEQTP